MSCQVATAQMRHSPSHLPTEQVVGLMMVDGHVCFHATSGNVTRVDSVAPCIETPAWDHGVIRLHSNGDYYAKSGDGTMEISGNFKDNNPGDRQMAHIFVSNASALRATHPNPPVAQVVLPSSEPEPEPRNDTPAPEPEPEKKKFFGLSMMVWFFIILLVILATIGGVYYTSKRKASASAVEL